MSEAVVTNIPTQANGLARLREKFPPEVVGKLPRVTCKECSDRSKNCTTHKKERCGVCGNWISTAHIHLDYVGHAEITDRLLTVDPEWTWEPVAFDERGLPVVNKQGNEWTMWIRLTVCGVSRLGVGSVAANAFDAEKQLIGDALRNAAMRFGVALDLWAKEELESSLDAPAGVDAATGEITGGGEPPQPAPVAAPPASTKRPPPKRASQPSPPTGRSQQREEDGPQETTSGVSFGGGASTDATPAITAEALASLRAYAARKGIDEDALLDMAGKSLEVLTDADAQALTTQITAKKS